MNALEILNAVCVECYDNGVSVTNRRRLDAIEALTADSAYRLVRSGELFHLYGKRALCEQDSILLVSTHVDCSHGITRCFSACRPDGLLCGTYDNAITNAAAVHAMLEGTLPDHVFFAFTGDEECESRGALALVRALKQLCVSFRCIVLDVTGMGLNEDARFTFENNFLSDAFGRKAVARIMETQSKWCFVPSDPKVIPDYIDGRHVIPIESQPDEAWKYRENGVECFSLCLPCRGEMHCDDGVIVELQSYYAYIDILRHLLKTLA